MIMLCWYRPQENEKKVKVEEEKAQSEVLDEKLVEEVNRDVLKDAGGGRG